MSVSSLSSEASPAALHAAAPAQLHPEPEWVRKAADELGYAWARISWQRAASQPGAWFDAAKADKVVAMWPQTFKLTFGRFAGKPFHLRFWEEVVLRLLVGWKVPIDIVDEETGEPTSVHVRLFQELRLWIARKNGKSEFLAALALLFWAIEGEVRAEGFCFASNEEQARIVFDKMGDMIGLQPALASECKVFAKSLWIQKIKAPFRLLTGKPGGKHGKAPKVTVGDEMHEWKSRAIADTLRQGEGAVLQPMRLYASTAGLKSQTVGVELHEESRQILDGRKDDPTTLVVIFEVPEDADWTDEKLWPLANPSIGLSPTVAMLRRELKLALGNPRKEAEFRIYHCNQFVDAVVRWLPAKKWNACAGTSDASQRIVAALRAELAASSRQVVELRPGTWKQLPKELKGRRCMLAFDSTKSFDLASLCLRFPPDLTEAEEAELADIQKHVGALLKAATDVPAKLLDRRRALDTPIFVWQHWLPAETIEQRTAAEGVRFDLWRDAGALVSIPGATFELDWAIAATREACKLYDVECIGYDAWNALEYYNRLVNPPEGDDAEPLPEDKFREMRFGTKTLGEATRRFEGRVFAGELDHGDNPVLGWMAKHCCVRFDENMNFVPAKKKSVHSIDGIVSAVMCEALALAPAEIDYNRLVKSGRSLV